MARNKSEIQPSEAPSNVDNTSAAEEAAAPKVEYREVTLVRDYAPAEAQSEEDADLRKTGVIRKVPASTVIELPRDEAKRALKLGIATVTEEQI